MTATMTVPITAPITAPVTAPMTAPMSRTHGHLLIHREDFQIRLANESWRAKSNTLVERMYSWRGYKVGAGGSSTQRTSMTVQACSGDQVFGTLNVGLDSPAGLACDALYKAEIDAFRSQGRVCAEFTRLAIEPEAGSKELLGALFHVAYLFATTTGGATDMFMEVNPRHVAFYKRMLNFSTAGECRICPRVDAPAVLLHLDVEHARQQIALYGGHRGGAKRSLYPYFCPPDEDAALRRRLRDLETEDRPPAFSPARDRRPTWTGASSASRNAILAPAARVLALSEACA